jgi:glucosylceramidase
MTLSTRYRIGCPDSRNPNGRIRHRFVAAAILVAIAAPAFAAGTWTVVETARDNGNRLARISAAPEADVAHGVGAGAGPGAAPAAASIVCDPSVKFQEIVGFGGALTESSAWVLAQLPPAERARVVRSYYDPKEGIGYTLARTPINSCDFSLGTWALDPVPGDMALAHFSLDPMRKWVLPLIH